MYMRLFCALDILDATAPRSLLLPEKLITLKPGMHEIELVDNPMFPAASGGPWYVLRGTRCGLPRAEIEKRTKYSEDCQLRVQLIKGGESPPPWPRLCVLAASRRSLVRQLACQF